MNDRIKELAKQAGFVLWADEEWKPDGAVIDWSSDYDNDLEKFAELIIQECMEQLVKEGDAWEQFSRNPPEGQETNASAALFAAYRLKEDAVARLEKHFGVEE
jgi:hypothetical protein